MALVGIVCYQTEVPADPPQLDIPNFGLIQKARQTLSGIGGGPGDLLLQFQDQAATALAPVRRYLEIVELFSSYYELANAIPQAIMELSPEPIFNALKNLAQRWARLISYIPPLSYIRMGMGIASYGIDCIDEIVSLLWLIDLKLKNLVKAWEDASLAGDVELASSASCSATMTIPPLVNILELLVFIGPVNNALLDPFIRLCPGGQTLQKVKDELAKGTAYTTLAMNQVKQIAPGVPPSPLPPFNGGLAGLGAAHQIIPIPRLGPVMDCMALQRQMLVFLYNTLAPLVGLPSNKKDRGFPTFQYL